jgi:hypothetical protein
MERMEMKPRQDIYARSTDTNSFFFFAKVGLKKSPQKHKCKTKVYSKFNKNQSLNEDW